MPKFTQSRVHAFLLLAWLFAHISDGNMALNICGRKGVAFIPLRNSSTNMIHKYACRYQSQLNNKRKHVMCKGWEVWAVEVEYVPKLHIMTEHACLRRSSPPYNPDSISKSRLVWWTPYLMVATNSTSSSFGSRRRGRVI
jgi:hypothetical protein